jgi:hypothetical protein
MRSLKEIIQLFRSRQFMPYVAAIAIFVIITMAYVNPVLEGKRLQQPDIINWQGMAKEITDFREETGEEALWTNAMFGGMPAFQISVRWANNIANFFHDVMTLWLPRPADMIFLYFAGFFIFLLMLKVSPWIALAGAIGFAFSSYHFIIIEAGHNSKAVAIGYMAPVLGSIIYTFRHNIWGGGLLFAVFMALQLFANHYQITYYLGIIVVVYGLVQLKEHISQKRLTGFLIKIGVLTAGLVIAIGINIGNFWGTYSYTSETMRGGSELTIGEEQQSTGLTTEYITNWSYGIDETLTLLIPNAKGGATGAIGNHSSAMDEVDPAFQNFIAQENRYWGDQPFTSGPIYAGAVVLFLFFMALFYVKGPLKWSLLIAIILGIMLSWGKNFMPLTNFFIDYVPGYNKFRAVSMTLVIVELCIPALAFLGLYRITEKREAISFKNKSFLTAVGMTAGLSLLFYLAPKAFFSFTSQMEAQAFRGWAADEPAMAAQIREFMYNLENARVAIFRADAMRSFLFAALAAGVTLLFGMKKMGKPLFLALIILLITIDMWTVNRRYLNDEHFVNRRTAERPFDLRPADRFILEDEEQFRVLDLAANTFNSSHTSYYHHSIGGYHGAKLQRYQDLIDVHLVDEMNNIGNNIAISRDENADKTHMDNNKVLNMLNTRYIIYHPEAPPIQNPFAAGNAWTVSDFRIVENADEEILALETLDIKNEALIDKRFAHFVEGKTFAQDPHADIQLTHYQPNKLIYRYKAANEQLAVFSEIYYPEGWEVRINGDKTDYFRVNYILRGMVIPAGEHEIEFRFKPRPYYAGKNIALTFSTILVLGLIAFMYFRIKNISEKR